MDQVPQLVLQSGALGLLAYLIFWTTKDGAPKLFEHLSGLRSAVENTGNRLAALEEKVEDLAKKIEGLRCEDD